MYKVIAMRVEADDIGFINLLMQIVVGKGKP